MTDDEAFLSSLLQPLREVSGLQALALGGSRARLTHDAYSDYDIGLYYRGSFDFEGLRRAAQTLDGRADRVVAPGQWGPWINGGGWLTVRGRRVDLLYRELGKVEQVVADCCAGRFTIDYQPGHPLGFHSPIYAGEVAVCRALWDPSGVLAAFPRELPEALRLAIEQRYGWEAGFSLEIALKGQTRGDKVYVAGCMFRLVMCLCQVLYARGGRWWMNEKGAVREAAGFPFAPADLEARASAACAGDLDEARRLLSDVTGWTAPTGPAA